MPFGAMVEYHAISAKDISRLHEFGSKVLPGVFLGYIYIYINIYIYIVCGDDLEKRHSCRTH